MNRLLIVLIVAALSISLSACVTTKKKKEENPSWLKKRYHNLTLHYNYWFNADELFATSLVKLNDQHKDNYTQLLPIFPYKLAEASASKSDMDAVIKKASTGIALHRPSAWTDDAYFLIGAGQYVKKDLETAEATFKYFKEEYNPAAVANKKAKLKKSKKGKKKAAASKKDSKKKETKKKKSSKKKKKKSSSKKKKKSSSSKDKKKPTVKADPKIEAPKKEPEPEKDEPVQLPIGKNPYKVGLFNKTRAAYPKSMIWFGRTLIEREKYLDADFQLREVAADPHLPKSLKDDLGLAQADLFIAQKKYLEAIAPLETAISYTKKKKERARLYYILSQLYEKQGNTAKAYAALEKAAKYAPTFELAFNAQLKRILNGWETGTMTASQAENSLGKMTKEAKNAEYRDQIYYTMAAIAIKNKQKNEAVEFLKQSLSYNTTNQTQKAESYIALADLYFGAEDFFNAKLYYDSTLTILSNKDERYAKVKDVATNLVEISKYLKTIADNDSIVRVFNMSPAERDAFAKQLKKQREDATIPVDTSAGAAKPPSSILPIAGLKPSTFYFYNETFVRKGKRDFDRIWQGRPLEDNWRRKSSSTAGIKPIDGASDTATKETTDASEAGVKEILNGLPGSEAELEVILLNTYEAMFQLGKAFRDKLERNDKCVATLEAMIDKFPTYDRHQAETWYYCHVSHRDLSNQSRANYYLDLLKEKHPKSPFTLSLTDPNFANYGKEKQRELNSYYANVFSLYEKEQYKAALEQINAAPPKFGTLHALMGKFSLIKAMCIGKMEGQVAYCKELKSVIASYPDGAEAVRGKEIARLISCEGYQDAAVDQKKLSAANPANEAFTADDDKIHYFLAVLHGADIKINDVKIAMTDYIAQNYGADGLKVSNIFLGTDVNTPILVVRKFDNKAQAMKFYNEVVTQKAFLGESDRNKFTKEIFPITQENYRRILKNRTMDGYEAFFLNNYIK
jgi:tetratricopeptide (TPR) repeat protein